MNEIRSNWPAKETLTIEITDVNLRKKTNIAQHYYENLTQNKSMPFCKLHTIANV
jgi:hypothetical protein